MNEIYRRLLDAWHSGDIKYIDRVLLSVLNARNTGVPWKASRVKSIQAYESASGVVNWATTVNASSSNTLLPYEGENSGAAALRNSFYLVDWNVVIRPDHTNFVNTNDAWLAFWLAATGFETSGLENNAWGKTFAGGASIQDCVENAAGSFLLCQRLILNSRSAPSGVSAPDVIVGWRVNGIKFLVE